MRWEAVIEFPKMKVAVATRDARVTEIRYLPLAAASVAPQNALARKLDGDGFDVARAVGQACGDNKLPIVIPCHRVVAADGIGGFAHATGGYLLEAKRWLLMHESSADAFELRP